MSRRTTSYAFAFSSTCLIAAMTWAGTVHAQLVAPATVLVPPPNAGNPALDLLDIQWKMNLGLGIAVTSGNSKSSTTNVSAEASRITDNSKLTLTGRGLYAQSRDNATGDDKTTGLNWAVGTQYDSDLDPLWFAFGRYDHLADRPANISARDSTYLGFGRHVLRTERHTWDVSGGLGYSQDKYVNTITVSNQPRDRYGRSEAVASEFSSHKLTDTTSLKQKLGIFPNLKDNGAYRAVFESGLAVSINSSISLTTGLTYRYDSDPGTDAQGRGLKKADMLFVTGLSLKFE